MTDDIFKYRAIKKRKGIVTNILFPSLICITLLTIFCNLPNVNSATYSDVENIVFILTFFSFPVLIIGIVSYVDMVNKLPKKVSFVPIATNTQPLLKNKKKYKMKLDYKKVLITTGAMVTFLILLNPSLKDFKEYTDQSRVSKKWNFLIFSIFEDRHSRYVGIVNNFFELNN